jgi:hypothetical protein
MPVTEEKICILDPAGHYHTGSYNWLTGKSVGPELRDYEAHWRDENGNIEQITLWSVDINTGEYNLEFQGSLNDGIDFFTSSK